jgi:hypothetical protein
VGQKKEKEKKKEEEKVSLDHQDHIKNKKILDPNTTGYANHETSS